MGATAQVTGCDDLRVLGGDRAAGAKGISRQESMAGQDSASQNAVWGPWSGRGTRRGLLVQVDSRSLRRLPFLIHRHSQNQTVDLPHRTSGSRCGPRGSERRSPTSGWRVGRLGTSGHTSESNARCLPLVRAATNQSGRFSCGGRPVEELVPPLVEEGSHVHYCLFKLK